VLNKLSNPNSAELYKGVDVILDEVTKILETALLLHWYKIHCWGQKVDHKNALADNMLDVGNRSFCSSYSFISYYLLVTYYLLTYLLLTCYTYYLL